MLMYFLTSNNFIKFRRNIILRCLKCLQAMENPDSDANSVTNGPNILDKERNLMNEDPKWQGSFKISFN